MTQWLTDEEMAAWQPFIETATTLLAAVEADLMASHDLSHLDYGILVGLSAAPDHRLRMSEIACGFGVDPSVITYRVSRMSDRGIVERLACPTDGRGVEAHLTAAGADLLAEAAPSHLETARREFIDHLTASDLEAVARVFRKIRRYQNDRSADSAV